MPRGDLAGDGSTIAASLLSRGYGYNPKQKRELIAYLFSIGEKIDRAYTVTDSSGWIGKSFVLPHKTYGDENLRFRDIEPNPEAITETSGTLQGWKDNVASRCAGNSRLILAVGASFAAPLLPLLNVESGGFHLVGATSQGKTTILSVAASVTGIKDIPHWRTTTNGLESIATAFNHLCLPLDEIGQADPRDVGSMAYMLANGQGKARMKRDLTNRQSKSWQLMVLSSGEIGMGSYMQQANINQKGGQEVRLPDIPAIPAGSKYGCFETIHTADTAVQFVGALEAGVRQHHGTALDAFLSNLADDINEPSFTGNLAEKLHLTAAKLAEATSDSAIGRVAKRFALVQVALGLAHKYNLLPFPVEQIDWAISNVFQDWLKARGGDGSIEIKRAIDNIQHLLITNEFSDRIYTLPNNDGRTVRNLLAYRKVDLEGQTEEMLVPPSVFAREFCNGVNLTELVKELQRLGMILPPREDGKNVHKRRVNGRQQNFYVFGKLEKEGVTGGNGGNSTSNPIPQTNAELGSLLPPIKTEGVTGVTVFPNSDPCYPLLPQEKSIGVTDIDSQNLCGETSSDPVTPVTPCYPQKNTVQEKISSSASTAPIPKVGDRVRYVGGMLKYRGWVGEVVKTHTQTHTHRAQIEWDNRKPTELIPFEELEVIV
jgi:putative DNA primase/helicase